jgi:tRNA(fMet)-specific endonuclease VapC
MKLLLDTNAYSALMRGHDELAYRVRNAERVLLSAIVVGELEYGFRNGSRYQANSDQLQVFLNSRYVEFLPVTRITTERFGRIAALLRSKGRPVPTNDMWVAAHTMETGAELVSFDKHFEHIDGLVWTRPGDSE